MIRQLHYLGLLLPLFTTSSWAAEQNSSVHIAPAGSHTAVYGSAENFIGRVRVDPLFNADNDIRGATFSAKTDLIDGTNILPFQARYIALGQSVAGTANADATFKVQYL
ncbi:hypothetical protein AAIM48_000311 [Escherichia coli]